MPDSDLPDSALPDAELRRLLDDARDHAVVRVRELTDTRDAIVAASESANLDDEHDPEGSTVGFERAQTSALLDAARIRLAEIEAARDRLDRGAYGTCETCGAQIPRARLVAQPAARTCVGCATRTAGSRRPA